MKRWAIVLCLLALLGAGTIWLWRGLLVESLSVVALSDGSHAKIVEVYLGPHRLPQPSTGLVARAIAKVAGVLPRQLAQSMPAGSFSGGGASWTHVPEAGLAGLRLHSAAIVGAGATRFLQGEITTNWVSANLPSYLSREWTSSGEARVTTYKCAVPMLVMACDGPVEGIWFTCRATNPESGETLWLQGDPNRNAKEPRFERLYDDQDFIAFMCSDLATNVAWQFTVGVHAPRQAEFYLDRPEWDGGKTSARQTGAGL